MAPIIVIAINANCAYFYFPTVIIADDVAISDVTSITGYHCMMFDCATNAAASDHL
jgi:hypothetical protein